jgi:two-component system sensor histidine kinase KdpD
VNIALPADLPLVSVDPVLFEQALVNLLDNAAKYTPVGSPIEIRAARHAGAVTIELSDRGPGLPPGAERRVFEKFFRGGQAGIRGVGLGLPICKAIVEAHGGSIDAENRMGGGALFRVTLPQTGSVPELPEIEAAHA